MSSEFEYTPGEAKAESLEAIRLEAFVAGFNASREGRNGEYPYWGRATAEDLDEEYQAWREGELESERQRLNDLLEEEES